MSAALDIQGLRAELAARHQVLLQVNDPIFLAVTLNDLVLSRYVEQIDALNKAARTEAEIALAHLLEGAKNAAAVIVTQSAQYIADQVRAKVEEELGRGISAAMTCTSMAKMSARVARWAAVIALVAASVCVGVLVASWH